MQTNFLNKTHSRKYSSYYPPNYPFSDYAEINCDGREKPPKNTHIPTHPKPKKKRPENLH